MDHRNDEWDWLAPDAMTRLGEIIVDRYLAIVNGPECELRERVLAAPPGSTSVERLGSAVRIWVGEACLGDLDMAALRRDVSGSESLN